MRKVRVFNNVSLAPVSPSEERGGRKLIGQTTAAFVAAMIVCAGTGAAQQSSAPPDSVSRVEIRTALRAFYYNRSHGNSNALLIDMLGSKVDANRSAPFEAIVASDTLPIDPHVSCMPDAPIDRAIIVLKGKWAHVSVPRCGATESTADQFRMIRLEERWRFVDFRLLDASH
jgi:hypothetical protein